MGRDRNYNNLITEKEGITILKSLVPQFIVPTKEQKLKLYDVANIDYSKYSRSIDGVILKVNTVDDVVTCDDFLFVEVKTTGSKSVTELPYGVFFGFTYNEEELFKKLSNYRLCIVHTVMKTHYLLDFEAYESMVKLKRLQYQINFKRKEE